MTKILIAEDDQDLKQFYKLFFSTYGYQVVVVETEPDVMEQFIIFEPDIVLLDTMLGKYDGRIICRSIKRLHPEMKVILASAYKDLVSNYADYGADAAIEKPFNLADMIGLIESLLGAHV